jgi:prefoldin alpha subunit
MNKMEKGNNKKIVQEKEVRAKFKLLGIPETPFIENVDDFMNKTHESSEQVLKKFQETYNKYKAVETRLLQQKLSLKAKIPEIERTLEAVQFLRSKQNSSELLSTHSELTYGVYVNAQIKKTNSVCLWLGANVMVEYEFDEAIELLNSNKNNALKSLERMETEAEFLKDQITTLEVNMARVFNWDVKQKRRESTSHQMTK